MSVFLLVVATSNAVVTKNQETHDYICENSEYDMTDSVVLKRKLKDLIINHELLRVQKYQAIYPVIKHIF